MKVEFLNPRPDKRETFRLSRQRFVSDASGCYVLTTFDETVLYLGLAVNLRRRFGQHLDDERKVALTHLGRAVLFHWLETDDINKVERTWMNIHQNSEATLPILNSIYSPTST